MKVPYNYSMSHVQFVVYYQFETYGENVIAYAVKELTAQSEALEAMADLYATYALAIAPNESGTTWPYVTLPWEQFEEHAEHVTTFSYDGVVFVVPIVKDVTAWNKYCSDSMTDSDVPMSEYMFADDDADGKRYVSGTGPFTPLHQVHPTPNVIASINGSIVNYDISSDPHVNDTTTLVNELDLLVLSRLLSLPLVRETYPDVFDETEPISMVMEPIKSSFDEESEIVGYVQSIFKWASFFSKLDWENEPIFCTMENTCGDSFSLKIDGDDVLLVDAEYISNELWSGVNVSSIIGIDDDDITLDEAVEAGICIYTLTVFPAIEFQHSRTAAHTAMVGIAMFAMVASFLAYDL